MNDAEVVSRWAPGADIAIGVVLEGQARRDHGTVALAALRDELEGHPPGLLALREEGA